MKMILKRFIVAYMAVMLVFTIAAQPKNTKKAEPVLTQISNKDVVQSVFPEATKVEKVDNYWFRIVDDKKKTYGYAMTTTDFCKDVMGYNNTTPIMVVTDKKFVIKKVALLTHWETAGYIRKLDKMGFFNTWDELKLAEATKIKADAYTGATKTAKAIEKNFYFLVENGGKKLPKK